MFVEYQQVFHFLSHANKFYRYFELVGNRQYHAALCGSIQLSNCECGNIRGRCKMFGLFQCILTGTAIQYQQHFVGRIGNFERRRERKKQEEKL